MKKLLCVTIFVTTALPLSEPAARVLFFMLRSYAMKGWWHTMTQVSPLYPKPKLDMHSAPPPSPPRRFPGWQPWMRSALLSLCLALLTICYCGPLTEDATAVLAVKRELPVYSVERSDDVVSISFDASWGSQHTLKILDILDEYDVKATFFLVGLWVDKYPELVKEIHDRGHEIGNHSASHPYMTKLSEAKMREELSAMSDKVEAITGERPTLFRPPYGDYNNAVVTVSRAEGYECVQWSVDSLDWKNRGVEDLIRRATKNIQKGDIVLFHNDSDSIADALPAILDDYKAKGLSVIPVSKMLLQGNTTIDIQGKQHPAP